ncbi:MAG: hypothetical protein ACT4P7_04340 [Gemmatimonadaceae bacterium]
MSKPPSAIELQNAIHIVAFGGVYLSREVTRIYRRAARQRTLNAA